MSELDIITAEIARGRLKNTCDEMCVCIERTARAQVFNETHDYSACLANVSGGIISMANAIAGHMASMKFSIMNLLKEFPSLNEGDVFLVNDSYHGGTHLQCLVLAMPVYYDGQFVMISAVRGHQTDIGGAAAGSYYPAATEIYQEGLRIPPLKIIDRGIPRTDLLKMLKANVRTETFLEDLNAMMSANLLAEKRVHDLYSKYGKSVMDQVQKYVLDYSERLLRAEIGTWPEGTFVGEDYFEHDMHGTRNLKVRAAVTIEPSKGELTIDFTGSSPQAKGFVNSPIANTYSGIFLAIAYSLPENWSANDGFYRAIKVIAPEGSIVNPRPPAPTGSCTTFPAISVINSVTEALSKAIPKKAGQFQPHFLLPLQLQGIDPRTGKWYLNGNRDCFYGGSGAIYGIDGWGGSCPYTAMVYCTPTEQLERSYPIVTLENEFVQDTGGSGCWRGMPGNRIRRRVYGHDATVTAMVLGTHCLVRGSCGGTDGGPNKVVLREGAPDEKCVETWAVDEPIRDGQIYAFQTGGGGGYGDPLEREPELVLEDVIDGYISTDKAFEDYKVRIDPKIFVLDRAATAAARKQEVERRSRVS